MSATDGPHPACTTYGADELPPLRPNMLAQDMSAMNSTLVNVNLSHSVVKELQLFNSRFHQSNFEGSAFDDCDFDGAVLRGCSLRAVRMVDCDVDHLVINGIDIGAVLRLLTSLEA